MVEQRSFLRRHGLLLLAVVLFVGLAVVLAALRYAGLRMALLDISVFDQALWQFSEGGVPLSSLVVGEGVGNFLGFHFAPLLLIFAPLYYVIDSVFLLQFLQILLVVSAVWPIYLSGRVAGLGRGMAQGMALLFLLHPFTLTGVIWDFHEVSMAVPLLSWALYAVLARKFTLLVFMCALLLLVKEHYGVTVASLGVLWGVYYGKTGKLDAAKGALLFFGGLMALGVVLLLIMPALSPFGAHVMLSDEADHMAGLARYAWLKLPFGEAFSIFKDEILFTSNMALYVGLIFLSFWRLSLGGILLFAAAAADILAALLSGNPMPRSPLAYHLLPIIPVMVIAGAVGLAKIKDELEQGKQFRMAVVLTLCIFWVFAPLPLPAGSDVWGFSTLAERGDLRLRPAVEVSEINSLLLPDEAVSAQEDIGVFFARRTVIIPFARGYEGMDKVVLYLDYPYEDFSIAPFSNPFIGADWLENLAKIEEDEAFELIYFKNNWAVFARDIDGAENVIEETGLRDFYRARLFVLRERYLELG